MTPDAPSSDERPTPAATAPEPDDARPLVVVLSGPNLDLLGTREPSIYGTATLADHLAATADEARRLDLRIEHLQSNHEGALIDAVHRARGRAAGIIVNAGALTHYSWALHDALAAFDGPVVELHLSNPAAREPWRHTSVIGPVAAGVIAGFGGLGYRLAVVALRRLLDERSDPDGDRRSHGPGAAPGKGALP